ncbi:hypothetical protein AMAG_20145 [Allomyces macrogynus ATCC 38327]|uniref:Chromo domain-containing protein n=1 Tax=Allomyces macrogynus (strain ATCC 38327) TaxID=578462 RepID=A0A0L0T5D0_ALLM3|nr:hypothetical protein AMAG_20145 [Allomyces macrogynus ATCC 38327]|eukprot:KNE69952.1 hypothetical protein AMAG_20145 [Allomyces macrogynus ATCC 38327]
MADPTPPDLADLAAANDDEYEVRSITGKKKRRGTIKYRVLWSDGTSTWEPLTNLTSCPYAVLDYETEVAAHEGRAEPDLPEEIAEVLREWEIYGPPGAEEDEGGEGGEGEKTELRSLPPTPPPVPKPVVAEGEESRDDVQIMVVPPASRRHNRRITVSDDEDDNDLAPAPAHVVHDASPPPPPPPPPPPLAAPEPDPEQSSPSADLAATLTTRFAAPPHDTRCCMCGGASDPARPSKRRGSGSARRKKEKQQAARESKYVFAGSSGDDDDDDEDDLPLGDVRPCMRCTNVYHEACLPKRDSRTPTTFDKYLLDHRFVCPRCQDPPAGTKCAVCHSPVPTDDHPAAYPTSTTFRCRACHCTAHWTCAAAAIMAEYSGVAADCLSRDEALLELLDNGHCSLCVVGADEVEKILTYRDPEGGSGAREYLVKFAGRSYRAVRWVHADWLLGTRRLKLRAFNRAVAKDKFRTWPIPEHAAIDPAWVHVHKVVAVQHGGRFLVKWRGLPISAATWETRATLGRETDPEFDAALARFHDAQKLDSVRDRTMRPRGGDARLDPASFELLTAQPAELDGIGELKPYQVDGLNWLLGNWCVRASCVLADEMGLGKTVQIVAFIQYLCHERALARGGNDLDAAAAAAAARPPRKANTADVEDEGRAGAATPTTETASAKLAALHDLLRPYFLRRIKSNVDLTLPPKAELLVPVRMTALQRALIRDIYSQNGALLAALGQSARLTGGVGSRSASLHNVLVQCRKVLSHPYTLPDVENGLPRLADPRDEHRRLVEAAGKLVLLDQILPRLRADGHKVLIFAQFLRTLDILEDYLVGLQRFGPVVGGGNGEVVKRFRYYRLDGDTKQRDRQDRIDAFNADEDAFVCLLSTRAGGVGINLTAADTVILHDLDWNPHQDLQAIARAHRIGQTRPVLAFKLVTSRSAEERMVALGRKKLALDHVVVQKMKDAALNETDLAGILQYGAQAVVDDEAADAAPVAWNTDEIDRLLDRAQAGANGGEDQGGGVAFGFETVWLRGTGKAEPSAAADAGAASDAEPEAAAGEGLVYPVGEGEGRALDEKAWHDLLAKLQAVSDRDRDAKMGVPRAAKAGESRKRARNTSYRELDGDEEDMDEDELYEEEEGRRAKRSRSGAADEEDEAAGDGEVEPMVVDAVNAVDAVDAELGARAADVEEDAMDVDQIEPPRAIAREPPVPTSSSPMVTLSGELVEDGAASPIETPTLATDAAVPPPPSETTTRAAIATAVPPPPSNESPGTVPATAAVPQPPPLRSRKSASVPLPDTPADSAATATRGARAASEVPSSKTKTPGATATASTVSAPTTASRASTPATASGASTPGAVRPPPPPPPPPEPNVVLARAPTTGISAPKRRGRPSKLAKAAAAAAASSAATAAPPPPPPPPPPAATVPTTAASSGISTPTPRTVTPVQFTRPAHLGGSARVAHLFAQQTPCWVCRETPYAAMNPRYHLPTQCRALQDAVYVETQLHRVASGQLARPMWLPLLKLLMRAHELHQARAAAAVAVKGAGGVPGTPPGTPGMRGVE